MATKKRVEIGYGSVVCTPSGELFVVETSAGRSAKASLIVRHASPTAPAEIVHEHSAKFQSLWCSPSGVVHAASNDGFHHSNESGTWKKTRVTKGDAFLSIGGSSDALLLASSYSGKLFARDAKGWGEVLIDGTKPASDWFSSFAQSAHDDVYAASADALLHFDGVQWKKLASPDRYPKSVAVLSRDEVYLSTGLGLYRGNARDGFALVASEKLQYASAYQGTLFVAGYSSGIL